MTSSPGAASPRYGELVTAKSVTLPSFPTGLTRTTPLLTPGNSTPSVVLPVPATTIAPSRYATSSPSVMSELYPLTRLRLMTSAPSSAAVAMACPTARAKSLESGKSRPHPFSSGPSR